jgi:hypothetical protein
MVQTKNVSSSGGGDDEDPPGPFRQVKGKIVYLEQQEGNKKHRMDRAAREALAAAAAAKQAERGGHLQISSDQIAYRVRRLASLLPPHLPPPTPASTVPPPAPIFALQIPPPRFRESDETEVRTLAADPRLLDLQRSTAARVRRFRHVPMQFWLPAQRDPAVVPLFSTKTQESFFRA